jgi:hypothetical protein
MPRMCQIAAVGTREARGSTTEVSSIHLNIIAIKLAAI